MSIISGIKSNKAISAILSAPSGSAESKQAVMRIKKIGEASISKLIDALARNTHTALLENLLDGFLNDSTLGYYTNGLTSSDNNIVKSLTNILSNNHHYDATKLLGMFDKTTISKKALAEILLAQHRKLNGNAVLGLLDNIGSNVRPIIYKILDKIVDESCVAGLLTKAKSPDPLVRAYIAGLLGRFKSNDSIAMLMVMLNDNNKHVRQSALKALAELKVSETIKPICECLRDPDLMVQSVAIDTLAKINDGSTVKHLIDILQDESEYVRRAAVEVLNEVGDERAIKDLLNALRDADWWVKVRAADALGSIGGPRVIDAVFLLIKDDDEFMRRTAVEILNTSNDPRAFNQLVEALKDEDWWVRERAADALAALGDKRAVPPLIEMLQRNPEASQVVVKALASLNDQGAIKPLIKQLNQIQSQSQIDILHLLRDITDQESADEVQHALTQLIRSPNMNVVAAATETIRTLEARFGSVGDEYFIANSSQEKNSAPGKKTPSHPGATLIEHPVHSSHPLIDALEYHADDVFADRYRIVKRVGKGAFGVVILVEDTVVHDEFILKFLHPQFAADEAMIHRFTHELRYSRKVTHENVIRIYDLIQHGKTYAISMEYFPSHALLNDINSQKIIPFESGLPIIEQVCSGMYAAQQVNVVHRDLKPSNILLNDAGKVKIVDFGLAAAALCVDSRLTKTGILVGTPTYMAPEQAKGDPIDSRTDIYSLGVIMYEMFTGAAPYKGEGALGIMFQHVEGKAKSPRSLNPDISPALESVIRTAMEIQPNNRFQTFNEFNTAVQEAAREIA